MEGFARFVEFLVAIGIVIAAVSNYLIINKLWKRKHLKDVAESVSISAALLGLATAIPLFLQFVLIDRSTLPAVKTVIGIITGIVFVLIGTGLWVRENRGLGFGRLFRRALKLERRESGDLLKAMIRPRGADKILRILERMASIDREVHEREIALINEFADQWKIRAPDLTAGRVDRGEDGDLLQVRQAVIDYLDLTPPQEQALQLMDVLNLFVQADSRVSPEEETVLEEVKGLIGQYVDRDGEQPSHEVVIVPQSDEQIDAVRSLIPGTELEQRRGGKVFTVGRFFSEEYAEAVSQKYISLGLFTTHVVP